MYAGGNNFPAFQQQLSDCASSGPYMLRGLPDLVFTCVKHDSAASSLHVTEDEFELIDIKDRYSPKART